MTDDEWRACASPSQMRGQIRYRPFPRLCWVRFNLACLNRVRDLLGPGAGARLGELGNWSDADLKNGLRVTEYLAKAVERVRRTDPLRPARMAAQRAIQGLWRGDLETSSLVCVAAGRRVGGPGLPEAVRAERRAHAVLMRCTFRSSLGGVRIAPAWRTDTVTAIAAQVAASGEFSALPILADALQDAGCDDERVLDHCRCAESHARGCWVLDTVLGKR